MLDKNGQRMSKTKNNGIDPLVVFDKKGAKKSEHTLGSVGDDCALVVLHRLD